MHCSESQTIVCKVEWGAINKEAGNDAWDGKMSVAMPAIITHHLRHGMAKKGSAGVHLGPRCSCSFDDGCVIQCIAKDEIPRTQQCCQEEIKI